MPDISIITPSYNMLNYLPRCVSSVADQQGIECEHIVVDGKSTDGTNEWLTDRKGLRALVERDAGMYDALNKGFRMANGELVGHLNCDEQYLPGTLKFVKDFFDQNPDIDILYGNVLLVRPDGSLIAFRKSIPINLAHMYAAKHLYIYTCSLFFRRKILDQGFFFDTGYTNIGDYEFVTRILKQGFSSRYINRFTSVFTMTGNNLSADVSASRELKQFLSLAPAYTQILSPFFKVIRTIQKFWHRAYSTPKPLEYQIYLKDDLSTRNPFSYNKASSSWKTE